MHYPVAHLEISDVSVTVVFAGANVEGECEPLYAALLNALVPQEIVLLWQDSRGKTKFIAPVQQHRFFETIKYEQLLAQADRTVSLPPP